MKALKRYVKERDKMLKKCSVEELKQFIKKHNNAEFYEDFCNASELVQEATLHKMIVNVPSLPKDLRRDSLVWLLAHGMRADIC